MTGIYDAIVRFGCDLGGWLAKGNKSRYRCIGDCMNRYSWAEPMYAEPDEMIE